MCENPFCQSAVLAEGVFVCTGAHKEVYTLRVASRKIFPA